MENINTTDKFSGAINLGNVLGTIYTKQVLAAAVTFAVGGTAKPGGSAAISIDANGFAINIPGAWIKYGGDDVDITAGKTNHLVVNYWSADRIFYSNKVV